MTLAELIRNALKNRLEEIQRANPLNAESPQDQSAHPPTTLALSTPTTFLSDHNWMSCDRTPAETFATLSRGELPNIQRGQEPPEEATQWCDAMASANGEELMQGLLHRYACVLNFSQVTEEPIREWVLEKLMSPYRIRLHRGSLSSVEETLVCLMLNLVGVASLFDSDLRLIDALNYYYETLFPNAGLLSSNQEMTASFLGIYTQSLLLKTEGDSE